MTPRLLATIGLLAIAAAAPALSASAVDRDPAALSAPPGIATVGGTRAKAALVLPAAAAARRIDLARPAAADEAALAAYNARREGKGQPLAIGFGRDVPHSVRTVALAGLAWTTAADGGRVARIEVASPGAAALMRWLPARALVVLTFRPAGRRAACCAL